MDDAQPYRRTPVFNEHSLPAGLRQQHATKAGVWGIVRVLRGEARLSFADAEHLLNAASPGLIAPGRLHAVEPLGQMEMQVEFYSARPKLTATPPSLP
jgi:tellurite resistance-related uncharacterized protein